MDMDIPSRLEGRLFYNTFTKLLWVILQPFFYTLRPVLVRPKPITRLEVINFTVQVPLLDISYLHYDSDVDVELYKCKLIVGRNFCCVFLAALLVKMILAVSGLQLVHTVTFNIALLGQLHLRRSATVMTLASPHVCLALTTSIPQQSFFVQS